MTEKILNSHAHIYPDKIATKAVASIGDFYDIDMELDGTAECLINDGKKIGCEKFIVCSVATTPKQVNSINTFIASECAKHPEFVGLGSLHPDSDNIIADVEDILSLGLHGVKLHPDFQKFNIDDEKVFPVYSACEGRLPILFHTGDDRQSYSDPRRLAKILDKFPNLTVIAAHLGGYRSWDKIDCLMGRKNVYIDTSSSIGLMTIQNADEIIHRHGVDRVIFGTDYPMWTHKEEFEIFNKLNLTEAERQAILWDNGVKLFNI